VIFWSLDTYYLWAERLFRRLYNEVRKDAAPSPFFMGATSPDFVANAPSCLSSRLATARRGTLSIFYGLQLGSIGLVIIILCQT
jgi:hypothetical protein